MIVTLLLIDITLCWVLAWHPKYPDGFIGRVALGGIIAICTVMVIGELMEIVHYELLPECEWLLIFGTVFLCKHTWNFFARIRREQELLCEKLSS